MKLRIINEDRELHPLDRKSDSPFGFGFNVPENNYFRRVVNCLYNIIERNRGISEKDFKRVDAALVESEDIVRSSDRFISRCELKQWRPELCAELIWKKTLQGQCYASGRKTISRVG